MSRILFPLYGLMCYLIFFLTFIYMIGFVHDFHFQLGSFYFVPVAIDFGSNAAPQLAIQPPRSSSTLHSSACSGCSTARWHVAASRRS